MSFTIAELEKGPAVGPHPSSDYPPRSAFRLHGRAVRQHVLLNAEGRSQALGVQLWPLYIPHELPATVGPSQARRGRPATPLMYYPTRWAIRGHYAYSRGRSLAHMYYYPLTADRRQAKEPCQT
jgi:hypothetical protein